MAPDDCLREHAVTLHGDRLVLRPLTESDWDILLPWNQDPEVLYYADGDDVSGYDLGAVQGIYRGVSQKAFTFMMLYEGRPVGECWLQQMNLPRLLPRHPGEDVRRIDLLIGDKRLWGHGLGTEAIGLLTRFGFEQQTADRIYACGVADYNPRSRGAFRKCGYEVNGIVPARPGAKARLEYDLCLTRRGFRSERRPPRVLDLAAAGLRESAGDRAEVVTGPAEACVLQAALPDFEVCCLPADLTLTEELLAPARRLRALLTPADLPAVADHLHDRGIRLLPAEPADMPAALRRYLEEQK